jgi:23S rRNA (cytosine1962-C5)-methyltransferase
MKTSIPSSHPEIKVLIPQYWTDYELIDSGNGKKLERFGQYRFSRPAQQAIWHPGLNQSEWQKADGNFIPGKGEIGGNWQYQKTGISQRWSMQYQGINFWAQTSDSRHMGVFPEQASHWEWLTQIIAGSQLQPKVLNLFGYTGIASLVAAKAGAHVTHVDASKKTVRLAKENQLLSNLETKPIRWIIEDAIKFIQREGRRNSVYDGIIMDPPKFGRGPKGEVWEYFKLMPDLLENCRQILNNAPLFIIITTYTIQASALSLYYALLPIVSNLGGELSCGELALHENSQGRSLSMAIYARWKAETG